MAVKTLRVGQLQTNCYFYFDPQTQTAFIIDPGDDADLIMNRLKDLKLQPKLILATHGHFDHVLAAMELKLAYDIPFLIHQPDLNILKRQQATAKYFTGLKVDPAPPVDRWLKIGEKLKLNQRQSNLDLEVISTPGHTCGSVCFYNQQNSIMFTGDTIFSRGGVGRTDLDGGNKAQLKKSLSKILDYSPNTQLYPGHGSSTTIKLESQYHQ